ncbi:MAG TPA: hypothetical protein VFJ12_08665 [Segeticoccus sp.]|nr:hypothetical protein [Segeticoccus sp.]
MHEITAAHWVYLVGIIAILGTMLLRKNIIVPAVTFTLITAIVFTHSLAGGLAAVFNASLVAAKELFSIFLIIALVTGMLGALRALGADKRMVAPFRPLMRNGHLAFWTLAVVTYLISLFFWPTPAVPLIGAVLIPVAIGAGLRPLAVGFTIAVAGQGMALSSDFIIRVAPGLSAKAAGVSADVVANRAMIMSLIVGGTALAIGYLLEFRQMRKPSPQLLADWEKEDTVAEVKEDTSVEGAPTIGHGPALRGTPHAVAATESGGGEDSTQTGVAVAEHPLVEAERPGGHSGSGDDVPDDARDLAGDEATAAANPRVATLFAVFVPLAYLLLIIYLVIGMTGGGEGIVGGDAAALVGGIAAVTIFLGALAESRSTFLERSAEHVVDGLVFAFRAMGVVLPIAGFFFIGNGDFSGDILGIAPHADGSPAGPALLFDLVLHGQSAIPHNSMITAFGILIIGMVAGLEGSGFSGLPLTGSLAGSLGQVTSVSPETLAAIGQMGNIWSGGGTLVAWSSLIAVAGFARVNVLELARKCFIPVVSGLVVATVLSVLILG